MPPTPANPSFAENDVPAEWGTPVSQPAAAPAEGGFFGGEETASSPFDMGAASGAPATSTRNVLNYDVSVVGTLRFTDDLLVDGSVEGEITSDGVLTVGANASIQAGALKVNVRHNTKANYNFVLNILKKEAFAQVRIDKIKLSDAKAWLIKLQKDGRGYSTIHSIRGVVRPAFEMALQDDLIRKNPFQFELATVVVNDSVTREAITRAQERTFLKFIQEDKHFSKYYDGIYILFNTGLRVSEFCGLTISDIDFKNKRIRVDHIIIV